MYDFQDRDQNNENEVLVDYRVIRNYIETRNRIIISIFHVTNVEIVFGLYYYYPLTDVMVIGKNVSIIVIDHVNFFVGG